MNGFGLAMGPILGSALYSVLGFKGTFFFLGGLVSALAVSLKLKLPDRSTPTKITGERLLGQQRVSNKDYFNYGVIEPILANRLVEKNLSVMMIGVFFAIFPVFMILTSLLVRYVPKKIEKRTRLIVAFTISCFGFLCAGPSEMLKFPDSLLLMGIGQAVFGMTYAIIVVVSLPEMIEGGLERYPSQEEAVNLNCPGMYTSYMRLGTVISPVCGSYLYSVVGFQHTTTIAAALNLAFALAYFASAGGYSAFKTTYSNYKKQDEEFQELND